jgi:hypothetical protein
MAAREETQEAMALVVPEDDRPSLDVGKALKLRLASPFLSYEDIGKMCGGVSKQAVCKALKPFLNIIDNPEAREAYRANKSEVLESVQLKLVSEMVDPEKVEKASINNLAYAAGQLDNMIRLDRGESTANIATYSMMARETGAIEAELEELQTQLARVSPASDKDDE